MGSILGSPYFGKLPHVDVNGSGGGHVVLCFQALASSQLCVKSLVATYDKELRHMGTSQKRIATITTNAAGARGAQGLRLAISRPFHSPLSPRVKTHPGLGKDAPTEERTKTRVAKYPE